MYTTEGIILKRIDVGEADSLFSIYTKDFGKIRALAQGVKKEGAKLRGHCEPMNLCRIQFVPTKNGFRLTHAEMLNSWEKIRVDIFLVSAAEYFLILLERNSFEGGNDPRIFELLRKSFLYLEGSENSLVPEALFKEFEEILLSESGFADMDGLRELGGVVARPFLLRYN